jgi:hypothetical protein
LFLGDDLLDLRIGAADPRIGRLSAGHLADATEKTTG